MHLLLGAALLAAPVVQGDPFCEDIQRLSAAVAEPGGYEALRKTSFVPRLMSCQRGAEGYFCHRSLLPAEITHETMAKRIAACLPGAVVAPGPRQWPELKRTIVTGGGLVFDLEESGAERAHVGRILHIEMRPQP